MCKKLVIFDLDGTLADAYPAIIKSCNYTMKRMGYPLRKGLEIRRAVGWGDAKLLAHFIRFSDLEAALSIYRIHHAKSLMRLVRFMPYARSLLGFLKKSGFCLAIASNRPTRFTKIILKKLKILSFFDEILCADKLRVGKPNPAILNKISKNLKLKKDAIFYVGDMVIDIETARRAGIKSIAIATGSNTYDELYKARPLYLFRSLKEVKGVLKRLRAA